MLTRNLVLMFVAITGVTGCATKQQRMYEPSPTFTVMETVNISDVAIINEGVQTHLWTGNENVFEKEGEWQWVEYVDYTKLVIDPDYKPSRLPEKTPIAVRYTSKIVHFGFDSTALSSKAKKLIQSLGVNAADSILLDGHTDNLGSDKYNMKLGERRAEVVKKYLIKLGVPESRIAAVSHGEREPLNSNKSTSGRQSNRRVVIRFNLRNEAGE